MRTRIKICGITRVEDATTAVSFGVDAVGLIFYGPSPRAVSIEQAADIADSLPALVHVVGVFVDPNEKEIDTILSKVRLTLLQFHGSESVSFCESFSLPYIKAIPAQNSEQILQDLENYNSASAILLDTKVGARFGGTGEPFDWKIAPETKLPLIVAGGLNPQNVFEAVSLMRPFAVDVSSGVEKESIQKDFQMMREFVEQVRLADEAFNEKG